MNSVNIMGRIANEPELKYTQNQKAVLTIRVAVDAGYATQDGSRQAYFFDVVAWEGTAQFIAKWFAKGQLIAISGKLQTRTWTDKHDQKRVSVEILAQSVYFCGERRAESAAAEPTHIADAVSPIHASRGEGYGSAGTTGEQARFDYRNDFRPLEDEDDVPF